MTILTVNVAGKKFIVDTANKGTAKAWGRNKLEVTVTEATGEEITDFLTEGGTIAKLEAAAKPVADAPAADGSDAAA